MVSILIDETSAGKIKVPLSNDVKVRMWHFFTKFELREEMCLFLEEERMEELAVKFKDKQFLMKLAYLSDIFGKLNDVNLQLQGRDKHIPHLADKISSFTRKLDV